MKLTHRRYVRILLVLFLSLFVLTPGAFGKKGGGGGGKGGGGKGGGWANWLSNARAGNYGSLRPVDPKQAEAALAKRVRALLDDGWQALRGGDSITALADFSDILELQPANAEATLGLGMAKACAGQWGLAQTTLETAAKDKTFARLANYNLAVDLVRQRQFGRAIVTLHRQLVEDARKPGEKPDELYINAQLSLIAGLDAASRKSIGIVPDALKLAEQQKQSLISQHSGHEPFGIGWVPASAAVRLKAAGAKEIYAGELPFILPDGDAMPLKGQGTATNSLAATSIASATAAMIAKYPVRDTAIAAAPTGAPDAPVAAKAPANTVAPPANADLPKKPVSLVAVAPAAPVSPPVAAVTPAVPARPMTTTARGAAFAVGGNLLLTCERLVTGATTIDCVAPDGTPSTAKVVAADAELGLALLKVTGDEFEPMAIAESLHTGSVGVAAFARASLFEPRLDLLRGDLVVAPAGSAGKHILRTTMHPRSAGSPVVDAQGRVVAMLSATREDPIERLPVVSAEAIRQFCSGKLTLVDKTAGDPRECLAEITVTRRH